MMKTLFQMPVLALCLLLFSAAVSAQSQPQPSYPQNYFRNPLGIPISLAANFGELRSNHFHMGFDIRTNQRENLPVYAAADGYVSRIKVERYGFGQAIYITHPNGFTTLYAHLNQFYDTLSRYIRRVQYDDEQWEQELFLKPGQFQVTKGQQIALSGNTGGSEGPHLHFEVRDTKTGNNLNPWLFNFNLPDRIPPSIYRLYYYDRRYSTYATSPVAIPIAGGGGRGYSTRTAVVTVPTPVISFGIAAEDRTSASGFRFGIYEASVTIDDTLRCAFRLNDISYTDTRYVNGSIDYKTRAAGGGYIQHLSRLPGNLSTIFDGGGNGVLHLGDTLVHTVVITVKDAEGNSAVLQTRLRWQPQNETAKTRNPAAVDLPPNQENMLMGNGLEAYFSDKAFYDTVPFLYHSDPGNDKRLVSQVHYLHNATVPVHDSFSVRIQTTMPLTDDQKDKVVMQLVTKGKTVAAKGNWQQNWMVARFRDLGIFRLLIDTIPPRIALSGWANGANLRSRRAITIVATDEVGELKSFNAYADGKWLLFRRKDDYFIHQLDGTLASGAHQLRVVAEDEAGNLTEKTFRFSL